MAIGAVHNGMELRMQVNWMAACLHLEIWYVGCAFDVDVLQHPVKCAIGRQRSRNAGEYAQVRVLKLVRAGQSDVVEIARLQGTKLTVGTYFSRGLRIQQGRMERHRPVVGY